MQDSAYNIPVVKLAAAIFRALGDEERLRILNLLLAEKNGSCVCELVDALRLPQYEVSRQLRILRQCGLAASEKRGTWTYYRVPLELPSLTASILKALAPQLDSETLRKDRERLRRRLGLRVKGVCVVGSERPRPFRERIPLS